MLAEVGLELPRTLPVDVEQYVAAFFQGCFDRCLGRAVAVAEHGRPFDELALGDHPVELGVIDEVIVHVIDFAGAPEPGGRRDGHGDLWVGVHQHPRNRRLPRSRRRGEDDQQSAAASGGMIDVVEVHGCSWSAA